MLVFGGRELAGLGVWLEVGVASDWMVDWRFETVDEVRSVSPEEVWWLMGRPALGRCWLE